VHALLPDVVDDTNDDDFVAWIGSGIACRETQTDGIAAG
jgi:hypothetical protein